MEALLHHVNTIFMSDMPDNIGREQELDNIKKSTNVAERILTGTATPEERASVRDLVHPLVRSLYHL